MRSCALLILLATVSASAAAAERPKLVVVISVDQLCQDWLVGDGVDDNGIPVTRSDPAFRRRFFPTFFADQRHETNVGEIFALPFALGRAREETRPRDHR